MDVTKESLEVRANAYIDKRVTSSGVPFPLVGVQRDLCAKLMAAFACEAVIEFYKDIGGEVADVA